MTYTNVQQVPIQLQSNQFGGLYSFTTPKNVCTAIAQMKTLLARSPVDTNHPWAQHVGVPTIMALCRKELIFRRKAIACWISASNKLYIRRRNWFVGASNPDFILHDIRRQVRYKNNEVEQTNERRPKVDTATRPFDKTSGNGDNILDSASSSMAACNGFKIARHRKKEQKIRKRSSECFIQSTRDAACWSVANAHSWMRERAWWAWRQGTGSWYGHGRSVHTAMVVGDHACRPVPIAGVQSTEVSRSKVWEAGVISRVALGLGFNSLKCVCAACRSKPWMGNEKRQNTKYSLRRTLLDL